MREIVATAMKHSGATDARPWASDPTRRDRLISGVVAVAVHGLLLGSGAILASPVEYGVDAGYGGLEVHLVAALPASSAHGSPGAVDSFPTTTPSIATEPPSIAEPPQETKTTPASPSSVSNATASVGDGSSPIPGHDATTFHASGGALTERSPQYVRNPAPPYPALAREQGDEGTVLLRVEVLPNGRCGHVEIAESSGHTLLDEAAAQTIARWRFRPARRGFEPTTAWVEIPVTFQLVESGGA
ncbi:MAG: energy transducer TonB [Candidatus Omnitrophica bacterium]|nr:energy transducer TonB [Candidatus Omnitrophota bacterium]